MPRTLLRIESEICKNSTSKEGIGNVIESRDGQSSALSTGDFETHEKNTEIVQVKWTHLKLVGKKRGGEQVRRLETSEKRKSNEPFRTGKRRGDDLPTKSACQRGLGYTSDREARRAAN